MAAGDLQQIATTDAPFYIQTTPLDGVNYRMFFAYNQRENTWYLSISDDLNNPLLSSIKLVCGTEFLHRWRATPGLPPGQLVCISLSSADASPPGLEDLVPGGRCELTYVATT